jgi:toxin ParE1/3/4
MNLPVILSPAADREFEEAAAWYEQQAGLGEKFIERVQESLDRIGQLPELHAIIYQDVRRVRVPGFPYNVLYRMLADRIEVIAVFHTSRDPKIWKSRASP